MAVFLLMLLLLYTSNFCLCFNLKSISKKSLISSSLLSSSYQFKNNNNNNNNNNIILNMMKSDSNNNNNDLDIFNIISNQTFSLWAGIIGIFVILFNRLSIDLELVTDIQSRADLISLIACSALLLNVLSEQDITARDRDAIALVGYSLKEPLIYDNNERNNKLMKWLIKSILSTTPVTSIHIMINGKVIGRGGVIGNGDNKSETINTNNMPILKKALVNKEEVYLPDLQILPGKVEFTYLPINAQSVLILPLSINNNNDDNNNNNSIILSTNQAKILKLNDLAKIRVLSNIFQKTI